MDCAICLNHIELHNESYLYPCFHRYCFNCIRQWTDSQSKHQAVDQGTPSFSCPLCKAAYSQIIYDCVGSSYRSLPVKGQTGAGPSYPLTAEQNRRRALYLTQTVNGTTGREPSELAQVAKQGAQARSPTNPQTADWVTRDLQAVLLEEDVVLIVQHVLGILRALADKQVLSRTRFSAPDHSPVYGQRAAFMDAVGKAVCSFLHGSALDQVFAEQLWSFLHSGLTIAAYDRMLFGGNDSNISGGSGSDLQEPDGMQLLIEEHGD